MADLILNHKFIKDDAKVFCVYPGKKRQFLKTFEENGMAFLELPRSDLSPRIVSDDFELRKHLRRTRDIAALLDKGIDVNMELHQLGRYSGEKEKNDRYVNRLLSSTKSLFLEAQKGDLIISPSKGPYREVLFGEIISDFQTNDVLYHETFGTHPVPFRRVRWIKKEEDSIYEKVIGDYLSGRPAVTEVKKDFAIQAFYDRVYGNYVHKDVSRLSMQSNNFSTDNFVYLSFIQRSLGILLAVTEAKNRGLSDEQIHSLDDDTLLMEFLDQDLLEYIKVHFSSPGDSAAKFKALLTAATFGAVLTLSADSQITRADSYAQERVIERNDIRIVGSDPEFCSKVQDRTLELAKTLGIERCKRLSKNLRKSKETVGLETGVTISEETQ